MPFVERNRFSSQNNTDLSFEKKAKLNTRNHVIIRVGALIILLLYIWTGAPLFRLLEYDNEVKSCFEAKRNESLSRNNLKKELLNFSSPFASAYLRQNKTKEFIKKYVRKVNKFSLSNFKNCTQGIEWNYENAILFSITIVTTIGYGYVTCKTDIGKIVSLCYSVIGTPLFLFCVSGLSNVLSDLFRFLFSKLVQLFKKKSETKFLDVPMKDVPLTLTVITITLYIVIGAFVFNSFENWSLNESAYFCFITLATIGFGDKVPGQKQTDPDRNLKLLFGSVYILIGLAVLAMCFDLVQEELAVSFLWLGRKLGLVTPSDKLNTQQQKRKKKVFTITPESKKNLKKIEFFLKSK